MLKDSLSPKIWLTWVALGIALLATVFGSLLVKQGIEQNAERLFAFACDQVTLKIQERLDAYALILRGGSALFSASQSVERQEWRAYVEALQTEQSVPGMQGIGFAQVIPAGELGTHIARIRGEGFPKYTVHPAGERVSYTSIVYIEPFRDRNLLAFGFDMAFEPVRRVAMEQARDTGKAALSGKVELLQETGTEVQAGTIMYVPVYRNGAPVNTVKQRRAALIGWVFSAYRMNNLMAGILHDWVKHQGKTIDLHIYDGLQASPASEISDSIQDNSHHSHSPVIQQRTIDFYGHQWLLVFYNASTLSVNDFAPAWLALSGGLALSGLLCGLLLSTFNTRANAVRIAKGLTEDIRHSQKLLKDSEFRWKFAIEGSGDGLLDWNLADNTVFFSKSWKEMLGFAEDEIGNGLEELRKRIHPEDTANALATVQNYLNGKTLTYVNEYRIRCKDGSYKWIHDRGMVVNRSEDGKPVRLISTHRDITKIKRAEEELRISILKYQTLFESSRDALLLMSPPSWRFVAANPATLQLAGVSSLAEFTKLGPLDLSPERQPDGHLSSEKLQEMFATALCEGSHFFEWESQRQDGHTFPADVLLTHMEVGGEQFLQASVRDITRRKQAEQELRISEERLNTITSSARDTIIMLDEMGNITFWNEAAERLFGYARAEVVGHNLHTMLVPLSFREAHFLAFPHFQQTGQGAAVGKTLELVGLHKDGSEFPLELSLSAVQVKGAWHAIGILHDISERKASETALAEARDLLQTIIDTAPIRFFWKDRNLRYLGCNRAFALDAGLTCPQDVIGKDDYQLIGAARAELYRTDDRAVLESGIAKLSFDEPLTIPGGQTIWIRTSKIPLRNQANEVFGLLGIYEDVHERKRLEDDRAEALSRLQKIASRVPGLVYQFRLRPDGSSCMPFASDAIRELYRISPEEIREDASKIFSIIHPDDYGELDASIRKSAQDFIPWQHEYRVKFDDGTVRWLFGNAIPERENDGSTLWHGFITDITERKQAEEKLQLAASVFTHAREGIMITEPDGVIIDVNDAFCDITGYSREEVLGQNPRLLASGLHEQAFFTGLWNDLIEKDHWYGEIWNRRKNGEVYAEMQTISAVREDPGNTRQYVALFTDITPFKEHEQKLERSAHYDSLTGLPNRVLLTDRLHQAMAQTQRRGQRLAVAYLDLDGFKAVNDNYGHEAGDQLLIAVATRMKQALREVDTFARMGGDEFVAVLLECGDIDASVPMLARLLAAAAQPVQYGDITLQVTASLGVTFYTKAEDIDADQLIRQADLAMYQAKLTGKNRYHFFDAEQDNRDRSYHESLEHIRRALSAREFVLYYQPKVNMRTGSVIGAEALIRWQHPERGLLPPDLFLPVIDDHPLAIELGEWVIDTALLQIENWHAAGLTIPVSVNLGSRQLQQADFVERLYALLAAHPNVRPGDLELEVLETNAMEDLAQVSRVIDASREIGVSFALDDFGTGYSSLIYLKRLPVSMLKIDQSFVRDMVNDADDLAIVEGVIGLATAFHRQVIAEGVETVEHGSLLLQLGCDLAQGYYIARPMPAHQLPDWLATWRPDPVWSNMPCHRHNDLPLLLASIEHSDWIAGITSYLKGERDVPPTMSHHQCRFGMWLDKDGLIRYGEQPVFGTIELLHRQVHALAEELCELQARGRKPGALERLGELHDLRDALFERLMTLTQKNRL